MSNVQSLAGQGGPHGSGIETINSNPPDGVGNYGLVGANGLEVVEGTNESTIRTLSGAFAYNTVAGTSQAAVAGNAYILTNPSLTTVSLPDNADTDVGHTFRIIGLSGGYKISQAADQQIQIGDEASTLGAGGDASCSGSLFNAIELTCVSDAGGTYIWAAVAAPQGTFTTT